MEKIYWQPTNDARLREFFQKTLTLKERDVAFFEAASVGREILVIPEIVKSCLFYSLGEYHRTEGDYLTTTIDYFYSIFHSAVAMYKVHFDYEIVPEREFDPKQITARRSEIRKFVKRLNKEELISDDYKRTYVSLEKRRDHVNYQPRVTLDRNVITFFACQYGDLVQYIEEKRTQLSNAILETAEFTGHALCFYHHNQDDSGKDLIATLYLKNWSNICIKTYQYWGSSVKIPLRKGMELHWDAPFSYEIGDKTRKSLIPLKVIEITQREMKKVLELVRANFLSPRIRLEE